MADSAFGNFQIFSPEGELLMFIGTRSERDEPAKYMMPSGIAVDEDGRVVFADQWFARLDVFRPAAIGEKQGLLADKLDISKDARSTKAEPKKGDKTEVAPEKQ